MLERATPANAQGSWHGSTRIAEPAREPAGAGVVGLPCGLQSLTVLQEQADHFPHRDEVAAAGTWPALIHKGDEIETFGLPGGRDAGGFCGQKLARWRAGKAVRTAAAQDGVVDDADRRLVVDFVTRNLPGLEPVTSSPGTCPAWSP